VKRSKLGERTRRGQGRLDRERIYAANVILGKEILERKKLECNFFLSCVFKDASFPPECEERIKIRHPPPIPTPPFHVESL